MFIEIHGDVWLLSDIVCIALAEGSDDDDWEIWIKLRGWGIDEYEEYDMDSAAEAKAKHIELIAAWKAWATQ